MDIANKGKAIDRRISMRNFYYRASVVSLAVLLLFTATASAQKKATAKKTTAAPVYHYAYQHGYRAGYEDGFGLGKTDFQSQQPRDFHKSEAYNRADRTYNQSMGTYLEYQEGYRYGIELGYGDGYFGRTYSVTMPANLGRVVTASINAANAANAANARTAPPVPTEEAQREAHERLSETSRERENDVSRTRGVSGDRAPRRLAFPRTFR
jgi:hypothetical protein